jgi:hypothetical protein
MEYGKLIRDAWTITWRYRFLWVLGLLAGGAVGLPSLSGSGVRTGGTEPPPVRPSDFDQFNPAVAATVQDVTTWAMANVGLLIALAGALTLVVLALAIVSLIAQGGMAEATAELATGHTTSFGRAWGAGVHLFWRYLLLWLVLGVIAAIVGAVVAAVIAAAVGLGIAIGPPVAAITFVLAAAVGLAVALAMSIVIAFAQRAIAVENAGPIESLQSGWRLMRAHLGDSLMTWLINVGLALASGVAFMAGLFAVILVLGGIGAMLFALVGLTTSFVVYAGFGSLVLLAVVLTMIGIANAFFWNYWTLAYLRLSGRPTTALA